LIENRLKNGAENGVEVRCTALATLRLLVEDDDDNKVMDFPFSDFL
jgi:hypothetical protein